ncbi:hypothetical protein [Mycobacterium leprae]
MTRSTVSQRVKLLEQRIGRALVVRKSLVWQRRPAYRCCDLQHIPRFA